MVKPSCAGHDAMRRALALLLALLLAAPALAQPEPARRVPAQQRRSLAERPVVPGEPVSFPSRTPSGPSALLAGEGAPATIRAWLTVPAGATGPLPAMVIAHGSGGILPGREVDWAARLQALGLATLVVDSFGPRGVAATGDDQSRLPLAASIADHVAALAFLAADPRIDAARIGIIGFSKGGQMALYTALEPFARGAGGARYALHIALYASCSIPYFAPAVTGAPVVFLLGGADDYTPAAPCARYADWFAARGAPVRQVVFPGAHHGFDLPTPPRFLPRAQSARACDLDLHLEPAGAARRDGTPLPAEAIGATLRACMEYGATFGGDATALAGAVAEVTAAVRAHLLAR
ncbi:dienelactone hydrolase family protein [Falsiroseomonas selenitidurans]|uniref:Dienelactone hydrolase domain-containing protein n=1 Tax=Falsiroseomonas selenitidurans TaxID=2716335 RepID=A0ABX1EB58_9PROT|nr:dienelactone hydrolase family protein [Falsiroseomonas selenitidurans]NKC32993.1 hypothetical protein [Falsiroseomonas selenitidurans]